MLELVAGISLFVALLIVAFLLIAGSDDDNSGGGLMEPVLQPIPIREQNR